MHGRATKRGLSNRARGFYRHGIINGLKWRADHPRESAQPCALARTASCGADRARIARASSPLLRAGCRRRAASPRRPAPQRIRAGLCHGRPSPSGAAASGGGGEGRSPERQYWRRLVRPLPGPHLAHAEGRLQAPGCVLPARRQEPRTRAGISPGPVPWRRSGGQRPPPMPCVRASSGRVKTAGDSEDAKNNKPRPFHHARPQRNGSSRRSAAPRTSPRPCRRRCTASPGRAWRRGAASRTAGCSAPARRKRRWGGRARWRRH